MYVTFSADAGSFFTSLIKSFFILSLTLASLVSNFWAWIRSLPCGWPFYYTNWQLHSKRLLPPQNLPPRMNQSISSQTQGDCDELWNVMLQGFKSKKGDAFNPKTTQQNLKTIPLNVWGFSSHKNRKQSMSALSSPTLRKAFSMSQQELCSLKTATKFQQYWA